MSGQRARGQVLAIGIDAAEPRLVRALAGSGELPAIRDLIEAGGWADVESPAPIGSGAVWPTFLTGLDPHEHGVHSEWSWDPERMSLVRTAPGILQPFWTAVAERGGSVGLLDVPFAPFSGFTSGFELCEWGAHDAIEGEMRVSPGLGELPRHPFATDRGLSAAGNELLTFCVEGSQLRGDVAVQLLAARPADLTIVVFTEVHHASHRLWPADGATESGSPVAVVLREVDRQIGRLIAALPGADVTLFSLHGMRPALGVAADPGRFLAEQGIAQLSGWSSQSWRERGLSLFAAAKRRAPAPLRKLYYRVTPAAATLRLAQTTMLPRYDWRRTRAFALPSDQHGWIRVNLRGREARGIVSPGDYEGVLLELETKLRALRTPGGEPLVHGFVRTSRDAADAASTRLPDLVVHWSPAAELPPFGAHPPAGPQTGQHASDGFVIAKWARPGERIAVRSLHERMIPPVRARSGSDHGGPEPRGDAAAIA